MSTATIESEDIWEQLSELRKKAERLLLERIIEYSSEGMLPSESLIIATNAYRTFKEGLNAS